MSTTASNFYVTEGTLSQDAPSYVERQADRDLFDGLLCLLLFTAITCLADRAEEPAIVFKDFTQEAGLVEPLAALMGHGGAWGDFDDDGQIDLYVGGFCDRPNTEAGLIYF